MPRRKYQPLTSPTSRPEVLDSDGDESTTGDDTNNAAHEDEDDGSSINYAAASTAESVSTFDARGHFELCFGDDMSITAMKNKGSMHNTASDDEQDDEDIINPYIMNPRHVALLPPSVELPPLRGDAEQQRQFVSRPNLGSFDPYYFNNRTDASVENLTHGQMDHLGDSSQSAWEKDGLLEMEEEIDFFSESIADERSSAWNSHYPKSHENAEYSEHSPLARGRDGKNYRNSFGRGANHNTSFGTGPNHSFMRWLEPLWTMILSFTTNHQQITGAAVNTYNPFAHRNNTSRYTPPIHSINPIRSRRLKFSHLRQIIIASSLLLTISTIGTVRRFFLSDTNSTITGNVSNHDGDIKGYSYNGKPNSLVLKKMEKAKRKWWRKNGFEGYNYSGGKETVGLEGGVTELQQQQQQPQQQQVVTQEYPQQSSPSDTTQQPFLDLAIQTISNVTKSDNAQVAVVVETGEDGSILIKLPPPKMGLEQPPEIKKAPATNKTPTKDDGTDLDSNQAPAMKETAPAQDDDTVYIKLPYQESQHRALSDAKEMDPPLRGATVHNHPNLIRRPFPDSSSHGTTKHSSHNSGTKHNSKNHHHAHHEHSSGALDALREEFSSWMEKHDKKYKSVEEKERRFHVWKRNHFRITEKNERHGPCRITGKAIFGHNLFSDLEPEEFQNRFLTGYRGPRVEHDMEQPSESVPSGVVRRYKSEEMENPPSALVHPTVQRKLAEQQEQDSPLNGANFDYKSKYYQYKKKFGTDCDWWDVSCMLRWIFGYQYVGGTREPVYDESTYPDSLDWRNMGVVSSVHAQGSCGACWAITAVETIESAYAIKTGELLDLAEEEVIACDGTCEMCNGGWPQNAYKYVMKHGGLPIKNSDYDGDFLYYLTATLTGESETVSENDMASYFAQTCPAGVREGGGGGDGGSGSRDRDNGNGSNNYDSARYGSIKGYGYATERCVCYTNGSGCDCDDQDEQKAVLNIASYGPAAVCLEASLWQSYEGGIMTSETGCGSAFLDMNHCVQVVGYAFTTNDDREGGSADQKGGSRDGGSRDGGKREGYWIVKNQWSKYWGMNGYAYLAMGDNTCGILNDMTQVYM